MNSKTLLFVVLLSFCVSNIQSQQWQWLQSGRSQQSENQGRAVCFDPQGNILVTGHHNPEMELSVQPLGDRMVSLVSQRKLEQRLFVAKYDPEGQLLWATPTRGGEATGATIASDAKGAAYVAGTFSGHVNFSTHSLAPLRKEGEGSGSAFLSRYLPGGQLDWSVAIHMAGGQCQARQVLSDATGLWLAGDLSLVPGQAIEFEQWGQKSARFTPVQASLGSEARLGFLARYSLRGELQGVRFFGNNRSQVRIDDLVVSPSGNVYLATRFSGSWYFQGKTFQTEPLKKEGLLLAFNAKGKLRWANRIHNAQNLDIPLKLCLGPSGLALSFASSSGISIGMHDASPMIQEEGKNLMGVVVLDEKGEEKWQHLFDIPWGMISPEEIVADSSGQLYLGGYFMGNWQQDSLEWTTTGFHSQKMGRKGIHSWWDANAFWLKLSAEGDFLWQHSSRGIRREAALGLACQANGQLATTGTFEGVRDARFGELEARGGKGTNIFVGKFLPPLADSLTEALEIAGSHAPEAHRSIELRGKVAVHSQEVEVLIWDNNEIDGDIVSLFLGEKCILKDHRLSARRIRLKISLKELQSNRLILQAENTGRIYPNTAALTLVDEKYRQTIFLASDLKRSQAVELEVK
jgi:hypothetical protein